MALVWGRSSIIYVVHLVEFVEESDIHFFSSNFLVVLIDKLDLFNRAALGPIYYKFLNKTINDYI